MIKLVICIFGFFFGITFIVIASMAFINMDLSYFNPYLWGASGRKVFCVFNILIPILILLFTIPSAEL